MQIFFAVLLVWLPSDRVLSTPHLAMSTTRYAYAPPLGIDRWSWRSQVAIARPLV
ncbi:hypothetical protein [Nostoc sp. FACHB-133]|uniref:hypothetical protein n=1 Tax=Nostoc sp. FACHB-133 TaxID=2692835 RepID=UPI0028C50340|nr:hypothetical protein [Nostoc sp. FACHB-133]